MRFITYVLMALFCFSCDSQQPPKENKNTTTEMVTPPVEQWLAWNGNGKMPHIVLISGDEEYRSEEALPQLAKILSKKHGFKCTVLFAQDPKIPGIIDPNYSHNIPGLEHLKTADMMVIFTRFRALPDEQMKHIDDFLKSGKPVLGMRTATHAFHFPKTASSYKHYDNYNESKDAWQDGFGRLVLGEHWIAHQGDHGHQSTKGLIAVDAKNHPILRGIQDDEIWGATDVYRVRLPLPTSCQVLVMGQVTDREGEFDESDARLGMRPTDNKKAALVIRKDKDGKEYELNQNDPIMPVAWTNTYQLPDGKPGKCFTTTMGASSDLLTEGTRRMLVNGVFWCLDLEVPAKTDVELVGTFAPTPFAFHKDEYWKEKNKKVAAMK